MQVLRFPTSWPSSYRRRSTVLGLIVVLLMLSIISLQTGPAPVDTLKGVMAWIQGEPTLEASVIGEIRLPRLVLAIIVGASLGLCGAALQGLLRNPLADPGVLGVSGGAALGAVLTLYFGWAATAWLWLPVAAVVGAFVALILIVALAGAQGNLLALILAGMVVSAMTGALIAVALNFAPSPYAMQEIVFWLMGSLANRHWDHVWIALPAVVIGAIILWRRAAYLDALGLGEDTARSLGFSSRQERWLLLIGLALCVGACVAVSGTIGFIGLVVPHVLRPLVGQSPRHLLLPSALDGAVLLVAADLIVRQFDAARELKLGVVTALVGGPFFLALMIHQRGKWHL